jgi:soluble lytic murein transglycosylase-like protein
MEGIGYAVTVALLALVPHLGEVRAKQYGDAVARASIETGVDPWMLVAVGRVETNWNADNIGSCCGGLMSIHWAGWTRYAERYGLSTDRPSLERLARDGRRSIHVAAEVLLSMQRMCGTRRTVVLGAYQSGACRANEYGRRVAHIASRYRARYDRDAMAPRRRVREREHEREYAMLPGVSISLGRPGPAPLARTEATQAAGP